MINTNSLFTYALNGDFDAGFQLAEICFKESLISKESQTLNELNEQLQKEEQSTPHIDFFKSLLTLLKTESHKTTRSELKRQFSNESNSPTGPLLRIMLIMLKSKDSTSSSPVETKESSISHHLTISSLYKKAIADAEAKDLYKKAIADAEKENFSLVQTLKQERREYIAGVLKKHLTELDELVLSKNLHKDPLVWMGILKKYEESYQNYLLCIIHLLSKETVLSDDSYDLTKQAIKILTDRKEKNSIEKSSLAILHLANIHMQTKFYEFTNLPEANYLLGQLERTPALPEHLKECLSLKRIELITIDALHFVPISPSLDSVSKEYEEREKKAHYQKIKQTLLSFSNNRSLPHYSKALSRLRLAHYAKEKNPEDIPTIKISLDIAIDLLKNREDSFLLKVAKGVALSTKVAEKAAKEVTLPVHTQNEEENSFSEYEPQVIEKPNQAVDTLILSTLSTLEIQENDTISTIAEKISCAFYKEFSPTPKSHYQLFYIQNLLLNINKFSDFYGEIISSSLNKLKKESFKILKMEAAKIQIAAFDEKSSHEIILPYHVFSHVMTQGWISIINKLSYLPPKFFRMLSQSFSCLQSNHLYQFDKLKSKPLEHRHSLLHLINTTKDNTNLSSKFSCYYPLPFLNIIADNYREISKSFPQDLQFKFFLDIVKFFKKAHFCNHFKTPYVLSYEWQWAIKFAMWGGRVANEENAIEFIYEIAELLPEKADDCIRLYKSYSKFTPSNPQLLNDLKFALLVYTDHKKFIHQEEEAKKILEVIPNLKAVKVDYRDHFRRDPFPRDTEKKREIYKTLGPSYPPFANNCIDIDSPRPPPSSKKRSFRPNSPPPFSRTERPQRSRTPIEKPQQSQRVSIETDHTPSENIDNFTSSSEPSLLQQIKQEARKKLEKIDIKSEKKRNRPKSQLPHLISETEPQKAPISLDSINYWLTPKKWEIFNKIFTPHESCIKKINKGKFDEYSFRNDVSVTRREIKKLVTALGGHYDSSGGKGSHSKAEISRKEEEGPWEGGDQINLSGGSMTFFSPQSQTMTLPKKNKGELPMYAVQQLRTKLLLLNISPKTVAVREA